jgi:hypothetical protein
MFDIVMGEGLKASVSIFKLYTKIQYGKMRVNVPIDTNNL